MSKPMFELIVRTLGLILIYTKIGEAMRFDLHSGRTKCISEDIKTNSMTVASYHIFNQNEPSPLPDSYKLIVKVTSPYGSTYHYGDHVTSGNFAFTAVESGDYTTCFWIVDHDPPVVLSVDFEWRTGVAAKDWADVAKKGQLEIMELELKKLYDTVVSIHDEIFYLREREEEMQQLNRSTNTRMTGLGFLSIVVCLAVAGMQVWHLKTYFERKKLL
ncbi:transmembrane emp24 domain-containing protein p24delta9-like [Euphorbia lathyris]|uniref:transmembrane emp24 domain-containing protein p24delta9-like n=1 Tax=Euphorbia lathyris TaxID=212925 RepID=UPI00331389D5